MGMQAHSLVLLFFFFNDTATTEIYTLSLHDALPIWARALGELTGMSKHRAENFVHPVVAREGISSHSEGLMSPYWAEREGVPSRLRAPAPA